VYNAAFSWIRYDQFGKYDIPAMIDHVINVTQQEKIHYIGHSMGTTAFMVAMNLKPEYAKKIKMANLMAPVAYLKNIVSPLFRFIARYVNHLEVSIEQ
jgi:lysosomal acid lipase/cholesteryl ester hydrolase